MSASGVADDVIARSALEQASLVRRGALSVEELTRAYLARVERIDPGLHAFVTVAPARALAQARALDRAQRADRGHRRSALFGLFTAMKDLHLVRGFRTQMGSRAFRYFVAPIDDVSTAAVRRAGLVIAGKLSTSELAILPVVDNELHPPTRNPWDRTRYSGGSSGGCSAAVSAGLMPIAVASDGGGSVRIPAAFCGLVGHKPTRGLLPNPFAPFEPVELSVVGPHARSVDDAAALMDTLLDPSGNSQDFLTRVARPPRPLRVRFTVANPVISTEPVVREAVERVVRVLASLGHVVEEGEGLEGSVDEFLPMFQFLARNTFVPVEHVLQPTTRWLREGGRRVTLAHALAARAVFRSRVDAWMNPAQVDVYVTPTVGVRAPRVGAWSKHDGAAHFREAAPMGAFTAALNASGHPATSIPVWPDDGGVPVGVQLVGHHGDDARLLALARVVLQALGTPLAPLAPV